MYPFFIFSKFIANYKTMLLNPKIAIEQGWITRVETEQIQPNAIDFTLDKAFEIGCEPFRLYKSQKEHRKSTELAPIESHYPYPTTMVFPIKGKTSVDCMSNMFVKLPEGVCAKLIIRSTLNRNGLFLTSGLYDSGFQGNVGCVLHNNSEGVAFIEKGACIGQIEFYASDSEGVYKGGYNTEEGQHWKK